MCTCTSLPRCRCPREEVDLGRWRRTSNFCLSRRRAPRRHTRPSPAARRHACPAPLPPRPTVTLRASTARCCSAVGGSHSAPQCLRGPLPRAHTGLASQQVHIDSGAATRQDTAEGAKAAIAAAGEQTGAEGRVPEGRHHQAQEAQLGRAQDCQGASEYRQGHHRLHSRRRYVVARCEATSTVG